MLSTRDILRKIKVVTNIQQICKAMKTVSSIKLKKAEESVQSALPYSLGIKKIVLTLTNIERENPLFKENLDAKTRAVVVIGADKGLAGSFNTNLLRHATQYIQGLKGDVVTVPIGRKVYDNFSYKKFDIDSGVPLIGGTPEFYTYAAIADHLVDLYLKGKINGADIIYTHAGGKVYTEQLLPISKSNDAQIEEEQTPQDMIFEPSAGKILSRLLPRYLRTIIYSSVLSSVAAEHSARVAAMSMASDNAEELIGNLETEYNKSRQTTITNELIDIVGAAEALN